MVRYHSIFVSCAVGALVASSQFSLAIAQESAANAKSGDTGYDIENIVVTASRRSELVRNIPIAVSAYSGDKLREAQTLNLVDLVNSSPNIQISASSTNANVTIRGIGNTQSQAGADGGVAIHFDGVYIAESGMALSTFLDLNRVEVLRGPQGTLFGRNATGGAINLIPNTPTPEFSFGFDTTFGVDPTALKSAAFVSGPITSDGKLRGRFAIQQNFNKGETRNLNPTGPRRLDGVNDLSARAQLELVPTDNFKARLLMEYQHRDDNNKAVYLTGAPDTTGTALVSPTAANVALPAILRGLPLGSPNSDTVYSSLGNRTVEAKTINLYTDWEIGGGNLKGVIGYMESDHSTAQDGDGTGAAHTSTLYRNVAHQDFEEVIYTSDPSKPFNFLIGGNHFSQNLRQDVSVPISVLPAASPAVNLGGVIDTSSYAVFGHATYEFAEGAKAFGGIRYTHDKKAIDDYNNFIGRKSQSASWSKTTYEGGVSYEITSRVSGYLKYGTGYKGGGFAAGNLIPAFNPETNQSLEAGLKGSLLNGAVQTNLSVFHMKYKNLQVNQVIGVAGAVVNAARATVKGLEAEFVIRPVENLRFDLTGGYLDATFDDFLTRDSARPNLTNPASPFFPGNGYDTGIGVVQPDPKAAGRYVLQLAGNRLPLSPKFTGNAVVAYDIPLSSGTITLGGKVEYKSKQYFTAFNIPVVGDGAHTKFDLSVRYKSDNGRWNASIFALNVGDVRTRSYGTVVSALIGSLAIGQYNPGRQIGVSFGYKY